MALLEKNQEIDVILDALEQIRPFMKEDGGDVEFISYDKELQKVNIKLLGSCSGCSMSKMTIKSGIEENLKKSLSKDIEVLEV